MKSAPVTDNHLPAPRHAMVKLDDIRIDGGTQQRSLSQEALESYEERRLGGEEFPAVQTVFDGLHHWLWDGFHRYHVARKVGDKMIMVEITQATQREAVWLSFGANKSHGVPRAKGCLTEIIKRMLADPEWAAVPQTKIARHVGVSQQFVSKVCASYNQLKDASAAGADSAQEQTRVVTRKGKAYQMKVGQIGKAKKPNRKVSKKLMAAMKLRPDLADNVSCIKADSVRLEIPTNHAGNAAYALYHTLQWSYLETVITEIHTLRAQEQERKN